MRVKICGITTLNDALFALEKGAWALGFNFYPKSPRYISPSAAKKIIEQLPSTILKAGLFIGESFDVIEHHVQLVGLDLAQVYDPIERPNTVKKHMILCLQANSSDELPTPEVLSSYGYILLDAPRHQNELLGGTGRQSNWELAQRLAKEYRLILAGGLNAHNVRTAINRVHPYAVDAASGLEQSPGLKDAKRIQQFLQECHDVN